MFILIVRCYLLIIIPIFKNIQILLETMVMPGGNKEKSLRLLMDRSY